MAAVLISSKYEDVFTITARRLIDKAGHGRFTLDELLACEKNVLLAIQFKISDKESLFNQAALLLV